MTPSRFAPICGSSPTIARMSHDSPGLYHVNKRAPSRTKKRALSFPSLRRFNTNTPSGARDSFRGLIGRIVDNPLRYNGVSAKNTTRARARVFEQQGLEGLQRMRECETMCEREGRKRENVAYRLRENVGAPNKRGGALNTRGGCVRSQRRT